MSERPWTDEPDLVDFEAHGLKCAMRRGPLGHWCGYVAVSDEHPLYGLDYDAAYEKSPDIEVHGGLTYAEDHAPNEQTDGRWWFGFDCAHAGDLVPDMLSSEFAMGLGDRESQNTYRDRSYVKGETAQLAKQLSKAKGEAS